MNDTTEPTLTAAQAIGILLRTALDGASLESIALRATMAAKIARDEEANRRAAGAIGVGLIITAADMEQPRT